MRFLNQLERKMGRHYIPELMKYLCFAMLGVFILDFLPLRSASELLYFNRELILQGQIWRLITFVALPPTGSLFFILINLYFYYFLGTALENRWGSARFNIYYAIGVLGNIVAGFLTGMATNYYLNLSLLLCFAMLYPEMQFTLFFFLPVKVKWIGIADAVILMYSFLVSPLSGKVALIFSLLPFFLFFGKDVWLEMKMAWKRLQWHINQRR